MISKLCAENLITHTKSSKYVNEFYEDRHIMDCKGSPEQKEVLYLLGPVP